eukprot:scaffold7955_cov93-Cylindrotheca_fusiformis.AAC.3
MAPSAAASSEIDNLFHVNGTDGSSDDFLLSPPSPTHSYNHSSDDSYPPHLPPNTTSSHPPSSENMVMSVNECRYLKNVSIDVILQLMDG